MIEKYCGGTFPKGNNELAVSLTPWRVPERIQQVRSLYEQYQFTRVAGRNLAADHDVDLLISEQKPWTLAEDPTKRAQLDTVLWIAADTLRAVAVLAHPVIPTATEKLWRALGQSGSIGEQRIDELQWGRCGPELRLRKRRHCFRESKNRSCREDGSDGKRTQKPVVTPPAAGASAPTGASGAAAQTAPGEDRD